MQKQSLCVVEMSVIRTIKVSQKYISRLFCKQCVIKQRVGSFISYSFTSRLNYG